jgi:hypothetical protein
MSDAEIVQLVDRRTRGGKLLAAQIELLSAAQRVDDRPLHPSEMALISATTGLLQLSGQQIAAKLAAGPRRRPCIDPQSFIRTACELREARQAPTRCALEKR